MFKMDSDIHGIKRSEHTTPKALQKLGMLSMRGQTRYILVLLKSDDGQWHVSASHVGRIAVKG